MFELFMKSRNQIDSASMQRYEESCCPEDEELDQYAAGLIVSSSKLQAIDSHLLTCHQCQTRLEKLDRFISVLTKVNDLPLALQLSHLTIGTSARLIACLVALVATTTAIPNPFIISSTESAARDPQSVLLSSTRSSPTAAYLPGQPLALSVDSTESITHYQFALSLVSVDGLLLKQTQVQRSPILSLPAGLPPGKYWIRLMTSESPNPLREFSLLVKDELSEPQFWPSGVVRTPPRYLCERQCRSDGGIH